MYHFFTDEINIDAEKIVIGGADYNHIKNVLRLKEGDSVVISDPNGGAYTCHIDSFLDEEVLFVIDAPGEDNELPIKITLYQGLAKGEKMETIIQKSVELGAFSIVPTEMKRCVVKYDDKKKKSKINRWQEIAKSAAKQSGRCIIPEIKEVTSFEDAINNAVSSGDKIILPYEEANGMSELKQLLNNSFGENISIFIGPEGGFEREEVELAKEAGAVIVSLGKRILRTETAGPALLSVLMLSIEMKED